MTTPLRVALVGTGNIARAHLKAYQDFPERVRLAAACDARAEAVQAFAKAQHLERTYTDFETLLREAPIDAVDLCTTHDQHAPLAIAAAKAGKHVLVEKPMACSLDECRAMIAAADAAGVTLMVAQCQRYNPSYRGVRALIAKGELGRIGAVRLDAMQNLRQWLPDTRHWLYDGKRSGGGIVASVAVHRIDLMRFLIGDVRRVSAITRMLGAGFTHGAEDFACAVLDFENGAIGEVFASWSGYRMPWGEQFMILGERGCVHAVPAPGTYNGPAFVASAERPAPTEGWEAQYNGFHPVEPAREELPTDHEFVNEILHFAACCQNGREPLSSGRDNLNTMKIVHGIYASARSGRPVDLASL